MRIKRNFYNEGDISAATKEIFLQRMKYTIVLSGPAMK